MELSKDEATNFFSDFFYGEHHIPSELKPYGSGWVVTGVHGLATYDFNKLTRLVVLAHDRCIRAEVLSRGMKLAICVHKRVRENENMAKRHPTLEDQVSIIRSSLEKANEGIQYK